MPELEFLKAACSACPVVVEVVTKIDFQPAWRRIVGLDRGAPRPRRPAGRRAAGVGRAPARTLGPRRGEGRARPSVGRRGRTTRRPRDGRVRDRVAPGRAGGAGRTRGGRSARAATVLAELADARGKGRSAERPRRGLARRARRRHGRPPHRDRLRPRRAPAQRDPAGRGAHRDQRSGRRVGRLRCMARATGHVRRRRDVPRALDRGRGAGGTGCRAVRSRGGRHRCGPAGRHVASDRVGARRRGRRIVDASAPASVACFCSKGRGRASRRSAWSAGSSG